MKSLGVIVTTVGVFLAGCAHTNAPETVQAPPLDFEQTCLETANQYAIRIDNKDAEGLAELFTEDGFLSVSGVELSGVSAIEAWLDAAKRMNFKAMHHLTSFDIEQTGPTTGVGAHYYLAIIEMPPAPDSEGVRSQSLISGVYSDEYVIDNGVCMIKKRIAERRLEIPATK